MDGWHRLSGLDVRWIYGVIVEIYRDGVRCDLYYHDRRHGGDGYSKLDGLEKLSLDNLAVKIRKAVNPSDHWYQLREAQACRCRRGCVLSINSGKRHASRAERKLQNRTIWRLMHRSVSRACAIGSARSACPVSPSASRLLLSEILTIP